MPSRILKEFLDHEGIPYTMIPHPITYTAQETASVTHTPGREFAKTVMVRLDGSLVMAVVPANHRVDLESLREAAGAEKSELAGEADFHELFKDCETGAMPPFGNLYNVPVYVDPLLTEDEEIAFPSGRHDELVRMSYEDFDRLVHPEVVEMAHIQ